MQALRVGALFTGGTSGDHFCTASVVSSPGQDLLITAAHCISPGNGSGYRQDIVFIPDYRDGQAPFGIWTPKRLLAAPQWLSSADPDLDVGFVVLEPHDGKNIEDILGANRLGTDSDFLQRLPGQRRPAAVRRGHQGRDRELTPLAAGLCSPPVPLVAGGGRPAAYRSLAAGPLRKRRGNCLQETFQLGLQRLTRPSLFDQAWPLTVHRHRAAR
jgi:hypothetical protein